MRLTREIDRTAGGPDASRCSCERASTSTSATAAGRQAASPAAIGFGSARLRGSASGFGADISAAEADRLLNGVLDAGIAFIDTAPDYGPAEAAIGRALSRRRGEFVLSTKVGCPASGYGIHDYTVANIRRSVANSLRRMRTDYLDIVQLHLPPPAGQLVTTGVVEELQRWQSQGSIGSIGVSAELPNLAALVDLNVFSNVQLPFSMLDQSHRPMLSDLSTRPMQVIARGVLARGAPKNVNDAVASVPEKYANSIRARHHVWNASRVSDLLAGIDPLEAMLRYALSTPGVGVALVATASLDHLNASVLAAGNGALPARLYADLTRRIEAVGGDTVATEAGA